MQVISLHRLRPCHLYTPPVVATDGVATEGRGEPLDLKDLLKSVQCCVTRRSKSRNKVAVGEPAAGSLKDMLQGASCPHLMVYLDQG